ncbi:MAG: DUF1934 domain-containing protein [Bacillaceae bacterium]|nr:DUF1934 domain-containing protein [Bacillaceae bacterium]
MTNNQEDVKVPIKISFQSEIVHEGQKERVSYKTKGQYYIKGNQTFLVFSERQKDIGKVNVIYKLSNDEIWVGRSGAVKMRQSYKLGEQTAGVYESDLGIFHLDIDTKKIFIMKDDQKHRGSIQLKYDLSVQNQQAGQYTISIQYEEAKSK